jgi:DNA-binding transcriptional MocR family regulator
MNVETRIGAAKPLLYEEVAAKIGAMIERGAFRAGDRIPSIRALSRQMQVSVNTVTEAYRRLEDLRLIEARPQSGYYVLSRLAEPPEPCAMAAAQRDIVARPVRLGGLADDLRLRQADGALAPLGLGGLDPDLLPAEKLGRMLAAQVRLHPRDSAASSPVAGLARLRVQIARRMVASGCALTPDEVIVTAGCREAITLALQAVCKAGDTVAVGSPVYGAFLDAMQSMGLNIIEIPSSPRDGLSLDVLAYALRQGPIHACMAIGNFNNPLGGSLTPDAKKRELVELLARHNVPLIEDDVYGDLCFAPVRPPAAKAFDRRGMVLLCSSFSKTLSPGYRIGWIAAGRYQPQIERLKAQFNMAPASPSQMAIAEFLANGGYDRHLRALRRVCATRMAQVREAVARCFPSGSRVSRPSGGSVLWVELPASIDATALSAQALRAGISVAPGALFTVGDGYRNCLRLNATYWSERIDQALQTLGALATAMA